MTDNLMSFAITLWVYYPVTEHRITSDFGGHVERRRLLRNTQMTPPPPPKKKKKKRKKKINTNLLKMIVKCCFQWTKLSTLRLHMIWHRQAPGHLQTQCYTPTIYMRDTAMFNLLLLDDFEEKWRYKYLHFQLFLDSDMAHVFEILPRGRQGPMGSTSLIPWLLMTWRRKEPGHQ